MKKIVIATLLASFASLNVLAADPATVNGKPVKQSLVDYIIKDATAQGRQVDDKTRAIIIDKLIINELIDQEAQKSGLTKQPDFLAKEELALHELRVKAYVEDFIRNHPISEGELKAEYDRLKSQSSTKEYKASHILVKTEDEAKALISQLSKGADFAQLAKDKSLDNGQNNGGDLGWFPPESMVQPFSDAVVKLEKGSITTTPVQTEFGWHVIKLVDTRDATPPTFDAVKKELATELQKRQLDKMVNDLRSKAVIINNTAAK